MFQHILVATDGSETAGQGVREAIALAAQQHAQLTVLHVLDFYAAVGEMQMANEGLFERHLQRLRQHGESILRQAASQSAAAGVVARVLLREAKVARPAEAIAAEAAEGYDLLVIGTHGRSGWHRFLLGSEAEQVLRQVRLPVLLVRPGESPAGLAGS